MRELAPGTDRWGATVTAGEPGLWTYAVEAWSDPVTTWRHHARIKVPAGIDTGLVLEEGARLHERAAAEVPGDADRRVLLAAVDALRDEDRPAASRLAGALTPEVDAVLARHPLRELVTTSDPLPLLVERERALYGAWYEFFPVPRAPPTGPTAPSAPPPAGCPRSPRWASTSSTSRRSTRSAPPTARAATTPSPPDPTTSASPGPSAPRRRPRRHPPRPGHPRGLRPLRRRGRTPGTGGRPRLRPPVLPRPPLGPQTPRVVPPPPRRVHRLRREPAQEVPGHLPHRLRRRPRRPGHRDRPRPAPLDGPRRADLPRRQPPHQTRRLLGAGHRRDQPRRPRRRLPRRGLHPPRDDAHPGPDRLPAVLHLLHLAQHQTGADGVPHRTDGGRRLLHAAQLLRQHPRHPPRLPPARRPSRLRGPRRPGRHPLPRLGHLQRLRTVREHPLREGSEEYLDSEKYQLKPRDWATAAREGTTIAPSSPASTPSAARVRPSANCAICTSTTRTRKRSSPTRSGRGRTRFWWS